MKVLAQIKALESKLAAKAHLKLVDKHSKSFDDHRKPQVNATPESMKALQHSMTEGAKHFSKSRPQKRQAGVHQHPNAIWFQQSKKPEISAVVNFVNDQYRWNILRQFEGNIGKYQSAEQVVLEGNKPTLAEAKKEVFKVFEKPSQLEELMDAKPVKRASTGLRGGKIIGETKSGKPIYDTHDHPSHKGFSHQDSKDAFNTHAAIDEKLHNDRTTGKMSENDWWHKSDQNDEQMKGWRKKLTGSPDLKVEKRL